VIVDARTALQALFGEYRIHTYVVVVLAAVSSLVPVFDHVSVSLLLIAMSCLIIVMVRMVMGAASWGKMHEHWQNIHQASRRFGWQIITFFSFHFQKKIDLFEIDQLQHELIRRQIALVYLMGYHLRGETERLGSVVNLLPDGELERIRYMNHLPLGLLQRQTRRLQDAREMGLIDENRYLTLEATMEQLTSSFTQSEDARNAQPSRITGAISKQLTWLVPVATGLALHGEAWYLAMPAAIVLGLTAMLFTQIGNGLENPYSNGFFDVPITSISRQIEIELRQMMGEKEELRPVQLIKGVLY
jgi:putative membrane protein